LQVSSPSNYLVDFGIQHSLTYNSATKIFSFIWNDPSNTTTSMTLNVTKIEGNADTTVCNSTATGATGVLSCDISGYSSGTFSAIAYRSASPSTPLETLWATLTSTIFKGQMGLFISFLLMILMIFMGIFNPIAGLIMGIASMSFAVVLGAMTPTIFIGIAFLALIVIHTMKRIS
jgi:hypothetical protein